MRRRYGLDGQFVAAHIGNMSLTYDFDLILNVAAKLPQITFVFAGEGSQQHYLLEQIAMMKLANVKMLGLLPYEEMPGVWAASDICLIALKDHSVAGGTMPAKLFEAMATGTPIVAAIRGEAEAILKESGAGIPTPIGNTQVMVTVLQTLYKDAVQLSKMSQAGYTYATKHFSPQNSKQLFLDIIKSVVRGKPLGDIV
jgi:glycosyltransferase involved in cell wall biosynthesis